MNIASNYRVLSLSATTEYDALVLGDGVTGNTVHQLYCLSTGVIDITARGGGFFSWSATTNTSIDVVPSRLYVNSGEFIAFKAKFSPHQMQR